MATAEQRTQHIDPSEATAEPRPNLREDGQNPIVEVRRENAEAQTAEVLEGANRSFFERMSGKAKDLASKVYEGLYKIPVVNRVVGKMEIAYKQSWADWHEGEAVKLKGKVEVVDLRYRTLDGSKQKIQQFIDEQMQLPEKDRMPGLSSLEAKVKGINEKQADLANERDRFQTKLEKRNGKTQKWVDKRDAVANKLIDGYGEKLKPHEENLENLRTQEGELDLEVSLTEVRHRETQANLHAIEQEIASTIKMLQDKNGMSMSERQAKRFEGIVHKKKVLDEGRARLKQEQGKLAKRKLDIRAKIAEADAKANPYRDKREEFLRAKAQRPVDLRVRERARTEVPDAESDANESVSELREQGFGRTRIDEALGLWNRFMQQRYGRDAGTRVIDIPVFLKKGRFSVNQELDRVGFAKAIKAYAIYTKRPSRQVEADLDDFLSEEPVDLPKAA